MSVSATAKHQTSLEVAIVDDIDAVREEEWNALVPHDDPFTDHRFLRILERSGSLGERTGWHPSHLTLRDPDGALVGAAPCYLKDNSYGEYIFDWAWADAAIAAGISYYPKLVSAVPFTPVGGRRLLVAPHQRRDEIEGTLLSALESLTERLGLSSAHLLFVSDAEQRVLAQHERFIRRLSYQFHWHNDGYESFAHYLDCFRRNSRRNVQRERRRAVASGLRLETLEGSQISADQWDALHQFYRDTTGRKWGQRYLTRSFFQLIREEFSDRVIATFAMAADERPVAGALFFHKGDALYGRYWGCLEQYDSLHFELCYYRAIEFCIERGFRRFEAGAQGLHKLKRGLVPQPTYSGHVLTHPALHAAVQRFVANEERAVRQEVELLREHDPFRRD
jgi:predicted N-acyltransferase